MQSHILLRVHSGLAGKESGMPRMQGQGLINSIDSYNLINIILSKKS